MSKVYADGNAAEHGGIEVGDQLAGINSVSAINLRVDEICTMITESPDPNEVELTFLRYTGPVRAAPPQPMVIQSVSSTDSSRKKPGRSARFKKGGNTDDRQLQLSGNKEKKSGRRFRLFGLGKKS